MMSLPSIVKIVEVGPRDGLQNEKTFLPTAIKVELIQRLAACGLNHIEATAFVSPKWVPQMADAAEVLAAIPRLTQVNYSVLTPNMQGFEAASSAGAREVAVFCAASEAFSQKNTNCSIAESLLRFRPLLQAAEQQGIRVRGYISCVLGCPFQGEVRNQSVSDLALALLDMGCFEISLGDTIGIGTPEKTRRMIDTVACHVPLAKLAGHFHDTYGMAIANIYAALQSGLAVFDSSVAGLGGCPYAPGAKGNVATEDLVYLLNGLGIQHGINLTRLATTGNWISAQLGRSSQSRVAQALNGAEIAAQ